MKVALIGATGFVGSHILEELLLRNYEVTAIARHVDKIKDKPNVVAIQLDINEEGRLASVLKGNEIVISAYNAGWTNPNVYDDYLQGSRHILQAVKDAGIKRFLVIGGAGSLLNTDGIRLVDEKNFPKKIKAGALAAADFYEVVLREDDLDWTFFSPAIQMNPESSGIRTGKYRTGTDHAVQDHEGNSKISAEDLAVAIVDEIDNKNFIQKRFTAGY